MSIERLIEIANNTFSAVGRERVATLADAYRRYESLRDEMGFDKFCDASEQNFGMTKVQIVLWAMQACERLGIPFFR